MQAVMAGLVGGGALALLVAACAPEPREAASPRRDYVNLCSECHGAGGKGDGQAAPGMVPPPADLTQISARNGGNFPKGQVAGHIYGHTMGRSESPMPQFGDLFTGETVLYETGDNELTPTPARLVALTDYLEGLQE